MNRYHKPPGIVGTYIFPGFLLLVVVSCVVLQWHHSRDPEPMLPKAHMPIKQAQRWCSSMQCHYVQTFATTESTEAVITFYQALGATCQSSVEGVMVCENVLLSDRFITPPGTQRVGIRRATAADQTDAPTILTVGIVWVP